MYIKNLKYENYNEEEVEETLQFFMTEGELTEMNLLADGELDKRIKKMIQDKDNAGMIDLIKTLLIKSYGVKSEDGKRFDKSKEVKADFEQSVAFSEMFLLLLSNADEAGKFMRDILPKKIREQLPAEMPTVEEVLAES